jgi:hypothetical protein
MRAETVTVTFRLPREEYARLEQAAKSLGESVSEYVRRAVVARFGASAPMRVLQNKSALVAYASSDVKFRGAGLVNQIEVEPPVSTVSRNVQLDEYTVPA